MPRYLSHKPSSRTVDTGGATQYAARQRGVSTWRIGLEILRLSTGAGGVSAQEYFLEGAWRPGLTWAERKQFVGIHVNQALNLSLNPPKKEGEVDIVVDKIASASRFSTHGLPQPRILAVASGQRPSSEIRWLEGPDAVLGFLTDPMNMPCFGKPVHASTSTGAASFIEIDDTGCVVLGSGQRAQAKDLVTEIWNEYRQGFIFQELVRPHPEFLRLIGPVIGTLRVVTTDDGAGPRPLYAALKLPAAGAMVDGIAGPVGCNGAVNIETGEILHIQDRHLMGGLFTDTSLVTGAKLSGSKLPDFGEALRLAALAHSAIGGRGILGVDILLSDRGPLVNEVNANPFHAAYQIAFGRGILNEDFLPRFLAVRRRFADVTPRPKLCPLR